MKFLVTSELGKLCKWLRILGQDALYEDVKAKSSIIFDAVKESRVIVTRDRKIFTHHGIRIVLIKSDFLKEQLKQIISELKLDIDSAQLSRRCTLCNEELIFAEKESIRDLVPEYVFKTQECFYRCPGCRRIYWAGTHWDNVKEVIAKLSNC